MKFLTLKCVIIFLDRYHADFGEKFVEKAKLLQVWPTKTEIGVGRYAIITSSQSLDYIY
jgi:hypothetical protein